MKISYAKICLLPDIQYAITLIFILQAVPALKSGREITGYSIVTLNVLSNIYFTLTITLW